MTEGLPVEGLRVLGLAEPIRQVCRGRRDLRTRFERVTFRRVGKVCNI